MSSERINGNRINLEVATEAELQNIIEHIAHRLTEATIDYAIAEDYLTRRFGSVALDPMVGLEASA